VTKRLHPIAILLACLALVACGDEEEDPGAPIPADRVQALEEQLQSIQDRFDAGGAACADITTGDDTNTAVVDQVLASIPNRVDADVRGALRESFDRLFQLVEDQCEEPETETQTTETVPPETETVPPETETVPPETETVPPETETVPPEETPQGPPETPPGQEEGNGNGNGGGFGPPEEGDG
jgi:hypothetical protein